MGYSVSPIWRNTAFSHTATVSLYASSSRSAACNANLPILQTISYFMITQYEVRNRLWAGHLLEVIDWLVSVVDRDAVRVNA